MLLSPLEGLKRTIIVNVRLLQVAGMFTQACYIDIVFVSCLNKNMVENQDPQSLPQKILDTGGTIRDAVKLMTTELQNKYWYDVQPHESQVSNLDVLDELVLEKSTPANNQLVLIAERLATDPEGTQIGLDMLGDYFHAKVTQIQERRNEIQQEMGQEEYEVRTSGGTRTMEKMTPKRIAQLKNAARNLVKERNMYNRFSRTSRSLVRGENVSPLRRYTLQQFVSQRATDYQLVGRYLRHNITSSSYSLEQMSNGQALGEMTKRREAAERGERNAKVFKMFETKLQMKAPTALKR